MDKVQAVKQIEQVFDQKFDEARFSQFCVSLFNDFDRSKATAIQSGNYVYEPYRDHIKSFKRIGQYLSPDEEILDVLAVKVHGGFKLERTRTGLRNFAIEYLQRKGNRDTLLIAFYADDSSDWRLSFIKLEYKTQKDKKGRIKAIQEATSARRYSFLVGENEPCHTAKKEFLPLLAETEINPDIADVEACFNIEKVTKEFFEQYKLLFLNLKENLDALLKKDKSISADFSSKGIETEAFAKKLLGQIVFLYFIQKKGWLGVPKHESFGKGDKRFLKSLFKKSEEEGGNYFNAFLEPLFYEALAVQRSSADPSYYRPFDCRIPFLNGGLFEPIKDYDWKKTEINLPNEVFSNCEPTKDNDIGTGILDVFDRYNFTVKEDEPLDKEVAVDPEMLGKVFENLLEVKDRKSKGTYYTPREIVHYMCQESLINYLDTSINSGTVSYQELAVDQTDLLGNTARKQTKLEFEHKDIKISKDDIDVFIKNSHLVIADNRSGKSQRTWQLPISIKTHAKLFDKALADIKVCDPAIGSGAFPVGMLNEIVRARTALTPFIGKKETEEDRTQYHLKRECIQNSLYGVDIDDSAIDIAKLRLWLSLVVDEDSIQDIEPLPNLDYKVVCGNSLHEIKTDAFNVPLFQELEKKKDEYFSLTDRNHKLQIHRDIEDLINQISNGKKEFDFGVYFSEVWHYKNGFDIVIGNPPYQGFQGIDKKLKQYLKAHYTSANGKYDLYIPFIEKGYRILHKDGFFIFICPTAFTKRDHGAQIRNLLLKNVSISEMVDFEHTQMFDNATNYTGIFSFWKTINHRNAINYKYGFESKPISIKQNELSESPWIIRDGESEQIVGKIASLDYIHNLQTVANISEGLVTGLNDLYLLNQRSLEKNKFEKQYFFPCLRGKDIEAYKIKKSEDYVFYPYTLVNGKTKPISENEFKKNSPNYYSYLKKQMDRITSRAYFAKSSKAWYELWNQRKFVNFDGLKIVTPELSEKNRFALADANLFYGDTVCGIKLKGQHTTKDDNLVLLAMLNSKITEWFYKKTTVPKAGGYFIYKVMFLNNIPVIDSEKLPENSLAYHSYKKLCDIVSGQTSQIEISNQSILLDALCASIYKLTESEYQKVLEGTEDTFRITALNYFRDIQKGILK